jgi:hypothetical protein
MKINDIESSHTIHKVISVIIPMSYYYGHMGKLMKSWVLKKMQVECFTSKQEHVGF